MLIENMTLTLDLPQLAAILTLVLLGLVVAARLANGPFLDGLNMARTPTLRRLLVALLFVGPFLALIFAAVSLELAVAVLQREHEAVRNLGLLLTGVIGAGLVAWRNWTASRQADLQDEALFNDKINAAAEDLAARRQVTTVLKAGDERTVITEWQDDVVTRSAAIDRLEGLANERPAITPRVAALLSIYVRELSKGDLRPRDHGLEGEAATPEAIVEWARGLGPIRSDLEKAAQVLGRLREIEGQGNLVLDLREANLQGLDLSRLNFADADLSFAWLQGAAIWNTKLDTANLTGAHLEGADLEGASIRAYLSQAHMLGARLSFSDMSHTELSGADLYGAIMHETVFDVFTSVTQDALAGAGVSDVDWSSSTITPREANHMFGDASVVLPFENPEWWPDVALDRGYWGSETELSPWRIEFNHWLSNPDTYDWSRRRQHYTPHGRIDPAHTPPEWQG
jgi:hypothetical protein